jgi:hypothetical protein
MTATKKLSLGAIPMIGILVLMWLGGCFTKTPQPPVSTPVSQSTPAAVAPVAPIAPVTTPTCVCPSRRVRRVLQAAPIVRMTPPVQQPAPVAQVAPAPQAPVAQSTDNKKYYTPEEIQDMVKAAVANAIPKTSPAPAPTPVNVTVAPPAEGPKVDLLTRVCAKPLDSKGNCPKWRKATNKDWEKQFPAPTSYADLQLKRQADSQHSLVKIGIVDTALNGVTAGSTLAGVVKNGNPTAIANANASATASSAASAVAAEKAGFGVIQ